MYVRVDDALKDHPELAPWRPAVGIAPKLSDAELVTVAVMQALLGFTSETRWLRHADKHLKAMFPYLPGQAGYNKRLRGAAGLIQALIRILASDTTAWADDTWLIDSTPVECGRSRPTAKRSNLAGWASYGYCASHSRYFWGLRLHLVCTPAGLPITFALANPKTDERDVARDLFGIEPGLLASRGGQTVIADKGYASREFEAFLNDRGVTLLRPAFKTETPSRRPAPQAVPPDRVGQRHPQRPTRSLTTRRTNPPPESPPASCNASSPSPPPSGTTTTATRPACGPSSPTTTDEPLELII